MYMMYSNRLPERADRLQQYLLLHSRCKALEEDIECVASSLHPLASPLRARSTSKSSSGSEGHDRPPASLVALGRHRRRSLSNKQQNRRRALTQTVSIPIVADESTLNDTEGKETKLNDLKLQIKCALTNLLNCEGVKTDMRYRAWVQKRLMDTEKDLGDFRRQACENSKNELIFGGNVSRNEEKAEWKVR